MSDWSQVRWMEAGQVIELAGLPPDVEHARSSPLSYLARLKTSGRADDALVFTIMALPSLAAIALALRHAERVAEDNERHALSIVRKWLQSPTEERRRAAGEAAAALRYRTPAGFAALSVFWSMGSLAPTGRPVVPPPSGLCGKAALAAVKLALARGKPGGFAARRNAALTEAETLTSEPFRPPCEADDPS